MHESFNSLLKLILPESIEEYFEVINTKKEGDEIHIYLKELNKTPVEYSSNKLVSKGFFDEVTIQDFPIRGFKVLLHVTRRRWTKHKSCGAENKSGFLLENIFICMNRLMFS